MQDKVLVHILCGIIVLLVIVVILLAMRISALNRFIDSRHRIPLPVIKGSVAGRYETLKRFYHLLYLVCDNFPKYQDRIVQFVSLAHSDGSVSNLCSDIVHVTKLCEGGSIEKLAQQYKLTDVETRTCCFIYWGFKWQQTCLVENLTENAYNVRCYRIRKKFNLAKEETVPAFIEKFCRDNSIS